MGCSSCEERKRGNKIILETRSCVTVKKSANKLVRHEYTVKKEKISGQRGESRRKSRYDGHCNNADAKFKDEALCEKCKHKTRQLDSLEQTNNQCRKKMKDANRRLAELERAIEDDIQKLQVKRQEYLNMMTKEKVERKCSSSTKVTKSKHEPDHSLLKEQKQKREKKHLPEPEKIYFQEISDSELNKTKNDKKSGDTAALIKYLINNPAFKEACKHNNDLNVCYSCCKPYCTCGNYCCQPYPAKVSSQTPRVRCEEYYYVDSHNANTRKCASTNNPIIPKGQMRNYCLCSHNIDAIPKSHKRRATDLQTETFYYRKKEMTPASSRSRSTSSDHRKVIQHRIQNRDSQGRAIQEFQRRKMGERDKKRNAPTTGKSTRKSSRSSSPDQSKSFKHRKNFELKNNETVENLYANKQEAERIKQKEKHLKEMQRNRESSKVYCDCVCKCKEKNNNSDTLGQGYSKDVENFDQRCHHHNIKPVSVNGSVEPTSRETRPKTFADCSNSPRESYEMYTTYGKIDYSVDTSNDSQKFSMATLRNLRRMKFTQYKPATPRDASNDRDDRDKNVEQIRHEKAKRYVEYVKKYKKTQNKSDDNASPRRLSNEKNANNGYERRPTTNTSWYDYNEFNVKKPLQETSIGSQAKAHRSSGYETADKKKHKQHNSGSSPREKRSPVEKNAYEVSEREVKRQSEGPRVLDVATQSTRASRNNRKSETINNNKTDSFQAARGSNSSSYRNSSIIDDDDKSKILRSSEAKNAYEVSEREVKRQSEGPRGSDVATQSPRSSTNHRKSETVSSNKTDSFQAPRGSNSPGHNVRDVTPEIKSGSTYMLTSRSSSDAKSRRSTKNEDKLEVISKHLSQFDATTAPVQEKDAVNGKRLSNNDPSITSSTILKQERDDIYVRDSELPSTSRTIPKEHEEHDNMYVRNSELPSTTTTKPKERLREHKEPDIYVRDSELPSTSRARGSDEKRKDNRFKDDSTSVPHFSNDIAPDQSSKSMGNTFKCFGNLLKSYGNGLLGDDDLKALAEELYSNFSCYAKCTESPLKGEDKLTLTQDPRHTIEIKCSVQEKFGYGNETTASAEVARDVLEPLLKHPDMKSKSVTPQSKDIEIISKPIVPSDIHLFDTTTTGETKTSDLKKAALENNQQSSTIRKSFEPDIPTTENEPTYNVRQSEPSTATLTQKHYTHQFNFEENVQQKSMDHQIQIEPIDKSQSRNGSFLSNVNPVDNLEFQFPSNATNTGEEDYNEGGAFRAPQLSDKTEAFDYTDELYQEETAYSYTRGISKSCDWGSQDNYQDANDSGNLAFAASGIEAATVICPEGLDNSALEYLQKRPSISMETRDQNNANLCPNYSYEPELEDDGSPCSTARGTLEYPSDLSNMPLQQDITCNGYNTRKLPAFNNCPCMMEVYLNLVEIYKKHNQKSPRFVESLVNC